MLPSSQCFAGHLCMRIVPRSDKDERRVLVGENLLVVGCRLREAELFGGVLCAQSPGRTDADQLNLRLSFDDWQQHAAREVAGADKAHAKVITGHRLRGSWDYCRPAVI